MRKKDKKKRPDPRALERIAKIRDEISALTYVCSGSLQRRMKTCGKPNCRCAHDPAFRHGPYYEWGRVVNGKLVHSLLPPAQAEVLAKAIENNRKIKKLLRQWEKETLRAIAHLGD